jgi:hypothetical protein
MRIMKEGNHYSSPIPMPGATTLMGPPTNEEPDTYTECPITKRATMLVFVAERLRENGYDFRIYTGDGHEDEHEDEDKNNNGHKDTVDSNYGNEEDVRKRPLADQAERVEKRLICLLANHRMNGTTFTNTMKEWFEYQDWVQPDTNETRLVGPQTEAILYVFFDIPCFFSRAELELFLGVKLLNHNVGGALLKMLEAKMIIKTKDKIGAEQFYLGHFGMEALQQSTIPDINNRPNNFLESTTLRTKNGLQLINERAEKKRDSLAANGNQLTNDRAATKKRDSPAKTSTKITPQQKRKKMK